MVIYFACKKVWPHTFYVGSCAMANSLVLNEKRIKESLERVGIEISVLKENMNKFALHTNVCQREILAEKQHNNHMDQ